ncbi:hypothetical protein B0I35DRAFT_443555 [Stachybotrys elegans]|uniref:BZIP domain-containing protein n=1 Tax=Stachybotrys elegans TaxID=80388 RepID=A0A8K0WKK3_9HYPO|nr:hypothetical protein B0I35DRAFT_443555 [Stachybotrys elegans]
MPQLQDIRHPTEDWTGLKDAQARRKLQNRLNVRAHRRRNAQLARKTSLAKTSSSIPVLCNSPVEICPSSSSTTDGGRARVSDEDSFLHSGSSGFDSTTYGESSAIVSARPQASLVFPLSSDHLITIVQYNVIRASTTNALILSIFHLFPLVDCGLDFTNLSLFPTNMLWVSPGLPASSQSANIPEPLRPTALQVSTPHELWIDLIPDPTFRDNVLAAVRDDLMDPFDFQADLAGHICRDKYTEHKKRTRTRLCWGGGDPQEGDVMRRLDEPGIVVWNDPWCPQGYEVTEAFLNKWAFLLRGCWDLMAATNRWRALRGEDPLLL